jgi:hypothetical protein
MHKAAHDFAEALLIAVSAWFPQNKKQYRLLWVTFHSDHVRTAAAGCSLCFYGTCQGDCNERFLNLSFCPV